MVISVVVHVAGANAVTINVIIASAVAIAVDITVIYVAVAKAVTNAIVSAGVTSPSPYHSVLRCWGIVVIAAMPCPSTAK